jgi:hypothetical protein
MWCQMVSATPYLYGSYSTGDLVRATYGQLRFSPILVTLCSYVPSANGHSLSLGGVSISMLNL